MQLQLIEKKRVITLAVSFLLFVAGYFTYLSLTKKKVEPSDIDKSIAVLPFVNINLEPAQDYLCNGLADGILNSLAKIPGLKVSARTSSFQFIGREVDLHEAGKKLGVAMILKGSIQMEGGRLRIIAQLINVESGFHIWSEQFDENLEDILILQEKIAYAVSEKLQITLLGDDVNAAAPMPPPSLAAYELCVKGRNCWNLRTPPELIKGIEFFKRAIELDSTYAGAYSGLADCYTALGYLSAIPPKQAFPIAYEIASKAIELDPLSAESHATLGYYRFYYDWDWEAAEQEFRRAIALNPNYEIAYDWYGYYLTAMERYEEAEMILKKAAELDPLSVPVSTDIGFSLYYGRKYDLAIKSLKASLEMNPNFAVAHLWLGRVYQQQKLCNEAIIEYQSALAITANWPVALAALGHTYGDCGEFSEARVVLDTMNALSEKKFVTSYGKALVYAGLGEKELAFYWLERAYEERSNWLVWLKTDPRWATIKSDKRFVSLVNRIGLPNYAQNK